MKLAVSTLALLLLTGCSVYKSQGREFLEREGLKFAKDTGQITEYGCSTEAPQETWVPFEQNENVKLSTREFESFDLLVSTKTGFNCIFPFDSAQEMYRNSARAADACLHLSPAACYTKFASAN